MCPTYSPCLHTAPASLVCSAARSHDNGSAESWGVEIRHTPAAEIHHRATTTLRSGIDNAWRCVQMFTLSCIQIPTASAHRGNRPWHKEEVFRTNTGQNGQWWHLSEVSVMLRMVWQKIITWGLGLGSRNVKSNTKGIHQIWTVWQDQEWHHWTLRWSWSYRDRLCLETLEQSAVSQQPNDAWMQQESAQQSLGCNVHQFSAERLPNKITLMTRYSQRGRRSANIITTAPFPLENTSRTSCGRRQFRRFRQCIITFDCNSDNVVTRLQMFRYCSYPIAPRIKPTVIMVDNGS
jgi:hypothetical protein